MTNIQTAPLDGPIDGSVNSSVGRAPTALEHGDLFISGQSVPAAGGARRDVVDPSTGQVVTTVAEGDAADVDAAVARPALRSTAARGAR